MTELIKSEALEVFIMFYAGLAVMMLIELKIAMCNFLKANKRIELFLEIIVWLLAAYLVGCFSYYCSFGRFSVYGIGALTLGALLWKKNFYGIITAAINMKYVQGQVKGNIYAKEKRENSRIRKIKPRGWSRRSSRGEKRAKRTG